MYWFETINPLWFTGAIIIATIIALIIAFRYTMKNLLLAFSVSGCKPRSTSDTASHNLTIDEHETTNQCPSLDTLQQEIEQIKEQVSDYTDFLGDEFTEDDYNRIQSKLKQAEQSIRRRQVTENVGESVERENASDGEQLDEQLDELRTIKKIAGYNDWNFDELEQQYKIL